MGLGRVLEGLVIFLYYLQLIFEPYSSCIFALPQNPTTITKSQFSNQVISLVIKEIILVCKFFREIFFFNQINENAWRSSRKMVKPENVH